MKMHRRKPKNHKDNCKCSLCSILSLSPEQRKKFMMEMARKREAEGKGYWKPRPPYMIDEKTGCWNATSVASSTGYGCFWTGKKVVLLHRYNYEKYKGSIPVGFQIDHLCRNRRCVNPDHLEVVTNAVNVQRGDTAKLDRNKVEEIRRIYARRKLNQRELGEIYGVSQGQISIIVNLRGWLSG